MKFLIALLFATLSAGPLLACEVVRIGDIEIEHAWSRASIGAGRPGVVYLTIRNTGAVDDVLTAIATPVSGMPMLHETVITDGVASMPHVMSVPVPAGETVELVPGGLHGMLMDLTTPLDEGATFPLTLTFDLAGTATVDVEIHSIAAQGHTCH